MANELYSHRIKTQQKKVYNSFLKNILLIIALLFFLIKIGIPITAKTLVFFSSFNKSADNEEKTMDNLIQPPRLDYIPDATNSALIDITGFADLEKKVILYINNKKITQTESSASDGSFIFDRIRLNKENNEIYTTQFSDDKESKPSEYLNIFYSDSEPKLEIEKPSNNETIEQESPQVEIIGLTDPKNKVTVNGRVAIVNNSGQFKYDLTLNDGENRIELKAEDQAGNVSKKEIKVTFRKKDF